MSSSARWGGLRPDPYNPNAFDADGDGIVQEGTAFERPAGMRIVDEFGRELRTGFTSETRPSNWRIVDKDGNTVDYIPTYQRTPSQPVSNFVGTVGGMVGTVRDRVGTIGDAISTLDKSVGTIISLPDLEAARVPEQISAASQASWLADQERSLQRRKDTIRRTLERLDSDGILDAIPQPFDELVQQTLDDDDTIANSAARQIAKQFYEHKGIGQGGRFYSEVSDIRFESITRDDGSLHYYPAVMVRFRDSSQPNNPTIGFGFVAINKTAIDEIEHDFIEFGDPQYRGLGIAQEFLTLTERQYALSGVRSIHGFASLESGPYMWARDGFDWDSQTSKEFYLGALEYNVSVAERMGRISKEIADDYRSLIKRAESESSSDPSRIMPLHFSFMPEYAQLATEYDPLDFTMRREVRKISTKPDRIRSYNLPTKDNQVLPDEMNDTPDMEKVSELISAVDGAQQIVPRAIASAFYQNDFSWLADQFAFDAGGYAHMGGDALPVEGLSLADMAYVMSVFREDAQASARRVADENGMVRVFRGGPISQTDEPVSVSLDRSEAEQFGDIYEYLVPVEAFEYEPPAGSSYAYEYLVNPNMMNLVNQGMPDIVEENGDEQSLVLPVLRVKRERPRTNRPLAEIPTNPGQLAIPRRVQDDSIVDEASAIEALSNGVELADIPSQFMHAAISANSRLEDGDPRKRFKEIAKNGGVMKHVHVYGEVDASGKTTNNGFVFTLVGPPQGIGLRNPLTEVAVQQILVSLGINASPATIDGRFVEYRGETQNSFYVVFPHAFSESPDGEQVRDLPGIPEEFRFKGNMDIQSMQVLLRDKGVRQRLANFVVSFGLAIEDRHPGNAMGGVFRDSDGTLHPFVVPIDMDIRGWDSGSTNLSNYLLDFRMDLPLVDDIKRALGIMPDPDSALEPLSEQEKEQLRLDLMEIWSQITERLQQLAANPDDVIESIVLNGRVSQYKTAYGWDDQTILSMMGEVDEVSEKMYNLISRGADRLSVNRDRFFKLIFGSSD